MEVQKSNTLLCDFCCLVHEFSAVAERPDIKKKAKDTLPAFCQLSPYCQLAVPSSYRGKSLGMLLTAKKITIVNNVIYRKMPATSENRFDLIACK